MTDRLFYVLSKFYGLDGDLKPSTWDNLHFFSAKAGYMLKINWDLGVKYHFAIGNPYLIFDMSASQQNYILLGQRIDDAALLNQNRLSNYKQLDFKVDKKFNFNKTSLGIYIDVQDLLIQKNETNPSYAFKRNGNNTEFATTDGQSVKMDGSNAGPVIITNKTGHTLPLCQHSY